MRKLDKKIIVLIGKQYPYEQIVQLPFSKKAIDITIEYLKDLKGDSK